MDTILTPTLAPPARAAKMMRILETTARHFAQHLPRHVEVDELIGAGSVGLAEAYNRRNGMPGRAFEEFARKRIRGAIIDELRRADPLRRVTRAKAKELARVRNEMNQELGREPAEPELAKRLGMSLAKLQRNRRDFAVEVHPLDDAPIADEPNLSPEALVADKELIDRMHESVAGMSPRARQVFELRYVQDELMSDIGTQLGVTEARVSQLHSELVANLTAATLGVDHAA
jgi:RNA polymerase sigma factor for flagellar operon FliA